MRNFYLTFLFIIFSITAYATHNKAGEITYSHILGNTYKVLVTTYTNTYGTTADRCQLTVHFGDGDSAIAPRINGPLSMCPGAHDGVLIGDSTKLNIYEAIHTFPGSGSFTITVEDPNRNDGICNIPGSVNASFFLHTQLIINPFTGSNNSVQFLAPPLFNALIGIPYIQNVTAYDPDGDVLTYDLIPCMANAQAIAGYSTPAGIIVNNLSGEVSWNTPSVICQYSFAVKISEWKNGTFIGYVVRDFQINVSNGPPAPIFSGTNNWNMNANGTYAYDLIGGDSLELDLDLNFSNSGSLKIFSDAFMYSNPPDTTITYIPTTFHSNFKWYTNTSNIRTAPYIVTFRGASTRYGSDVTLMICVHDNLSSECVHVVGLPEQRKEDHKI
jgi:hypothetical protein